MYHSEVIEMQSIGNRFNRQKTEVILTDYDYSKINLYNHYHNPIIITVIYYYDNRNRKIF